MMQRSLPDQGLLTVEAKRSRSDTPYSIDLDGLSARPTNSQEIDIHVAGMISTHNRSKQRAAKTHAVNCAATGIDR